MSKSTLPDQRTSPCDVSQSTCQPGTPVKLGGQKGGFSLGFLGTKAAILRVAASMMLLVASFAMGAVIPSGPQANVAKSTVAEWGWTVVYQGTYEQTVPITPLFNGVNSNDYVMYAAAPVGSSTYTVLAAGLASAVRTYTGLNVVNNSNNVAWYYNGYSIGFAPANSTISQGSADVANQTDPLRLSWHANGPSSYNGPPSEIFFGWRAGANTGLNGASNWNRFVLVAAATPNSAPTALSLSATSINENVAANSTVGTFTTTAPDANNTFTYTLVSGTGSTDNASFNISGNALRISSSPNYEAKSSYSVRVRTTDQNSAYFEAAFTITINNLNEPPTVTAVSPPAGPVAGNTSVTLTGTNFTGATGVTFGGVAATNVSVVSATSITCTTPANTAGAASVIVTTPEGSNNANTLFTYAPPAGSLNFDGGNDNVVVPSGFPVSMGECTIEFWVRPTGFGGLRTVLNFDGWSTGYLHMQFYDSQMGFSINGNSSTDQILNSHSFTTNTWHHVAVVYSASGKTLKWYVNGTLVETDTYSTAISIAAGVQFRLGGWNGNERFLAGALDEFRIWSVARSQAEIQASMNTEIAAMPPSLQVYYKFNQGLASVANSGVTTLPDIADASVQNGTLLNFALTGGGGNWVAGATGLTQANTAYQVAPTVTGVSPATGTTVGGAAVTITGTSFTGATAVTFGGAAATSVSVVNDTTITCLTPARPLGAASVLVTNAAGTNAANSLFTYINSAPTDITLTSATITENNAPGATVGTLAAVDLDVAQSHSFSLVSGEGDADNGSFSIDGTSLKLAGSANYEAKSSYSVRVQASDGNGGSYAEAFTISILDQNEAPTNITLSSASIAENNAVGATVGTLSAEDQDAGQSHSFSLVSGDGAADNASFSIVGTALKLAISADFETKSSYSVRVQASDGNGGVYARALSISIADVYEAPVATVYGNSIAIANGDIAPSTGDYSDFGTVQLSGQLIRTFYVTNTGNLLLNLMGTPRVSITGAHAGDFRVVTMPAAQVPAYTGSASLQILFKPLAVGLRTASITIPNDDPDRPGYSFAIQATAKASASSTISFSAEGYDVAQGASFANVTLVRTGGNATTSVRLTTLDGQAGFFRLPFEAGVEGVDYHAQDITVSFALNETTKTIGLPLIPRTGAQPNYRFHAILSDAQAGTLISSTNYSVVRILGWKAPGVSITTPSTTAANVTGLAPYTVAGTAADTQRVGITRVAVSLNGAPEVDATLGTATATSRGWSLPFTPLQGTNSITVTAYDANGMSSPPASRSFTYSRRYRLETALSAYGSINVTSTPAGFLTVLVPTPPVSSYAVAPGLC